MKVLKLAATAFVVSFCISCASSSKIQYDAKWNAIFSYADQMQLDGIDPKSRIAYGIINDSQFIYITLKTKDPNTVERIISNGLRVSLSPEGQKKDAYYIQFPVVTKEDKKALRRVKTDIPNSLGLNLLLEAYNKEALWKDASGAHFINPSIQDSAIKTVISMDPNDELTEQIIIPFELMGLDITQQSEITVNILLEGQSNNSNSGISPRIGFGFGGGMGVGFGGPGYNSYGNNDRGVDIKLVVKLATNDFANQ